MAKELTHRANELKDLGWSQEEINRYTELWDYRQRWGAINLEREDRQFLRKVEAALPEIVTTKPSVKKPLVEKSYYRWLVFYLEQMEKAEKNFNLPEGSKGLWAIILQEELRILSYYEPVLGLPDTLKAKGLLSLREEFVNSASSKYEDKLTMKSFDFMAPLASLSSQDSKSWRYLRDTQENQENNSYPVLDFADVDSFVKDVRPELITFISSNFPSLSDTDKPSPPDDWISK